MKNKNSEKGITIVALVLTIIILLILASTATYTGIESYNKAEQIKFVSQLQLIQAKVDEMVQDKEFDAAEIGNKLTSDQQSILNSANGNDEIVGNSENSENIKYFTKDELSKVFNIDNVDEDIIINFETREVISTVGFKYKGTTYYTQYKLPEGQQLISYKKPDTSLEFSYLKIPQDLSSVISITEVTRDDDIISKDLLKYELWKMNSKGEYEYLKQINPEKTVISQAGEYEIKVIDNVDTEGKKEISVKITNQPILNNWTRAVQTIEHDGTVTFGKLNNGKAWYDYSDNTKFAYAFYQQQYYLWIPRYAKNNEEIKFIKGNSNIFEDNTEMNEDWKVPEEFSPNGIEVTGFWLKVDEPNTEGKTIDTYLENIDKNSIVYVYE